MMFMCRLLFNGKCCARQYALSLIISDALVELHYQLTRITVEMIL